MLTFTTCFFLKKSIQEFASSYEGAKRIRDLRNDDRAKK